MCFNNDADWTAWHVEEDTITVDKPSACLECRRQVKLGGILHHVYLQEAEECLLCENGVCSCPEDKCCQCPNPDVGNTDDCYFCADCYKFRKAVAAAEKEAGCSSYTAEPLYGEMLES